MQLHSGVAAVVLLRLGDRAYANSSTKIEQQVVVVVVVAVGTNSQVSHRTTPLLWLELVAD